MLITFMLFGYVLVKVALKRAAFYDIISHFVCLLALHNECALELVSVQVRFRSFKGIVALLIV